MDLQGDADVDMDDFQLFLDRYTGPMNDCNDNGELDLLEILDGSAQDQNNNGLIDECESAKQADLNGDGAVDGADLGLLLGDWGAGESPADLNGDGVVDGADLGLLLGAWG